MNTLLGPLRVLDGAHSVGLGMHESVWATCACVCNGATECEVVFCERVRDGEQGFRDRMDQ